MEQSTITVKVGLDINKVPQNISWSATNSTAEKMQAANAMLMSFWDAPDKSALRIDLWTKDMMVDEMADFYHQTFLGMADSFERATHNYELVEQIKTFAAMFIKTFKEQQLKENKLV